MKLRGAFYSAIIGLKSNVMRSILTILGIVIGIVAISLVISTTEGAKSLILSQVKSMGSNLVVIRPGREPKGPMEAGQSILSASLKEKDIKLLENKNNVPHLADIAPSVLVSGSVSYNGETFKATTFGWVADWIGKMFNVYPEKGRFFSQNEILSRDKVAIIGYRAKKELFGQSDAVGQKIKIKGKKFRVVGVLPKKGEVAMFNLDDMVVIPYTTAQKYLLGINYYHEILAKATNEKSVPLMINEIKKTLRQSHNITDPSKDDFYIMDQADMASKLDSITKILAVLLLAVAAISLAVGGVGIMNIMLVSVTERTREIGLRKAVGATKKDILTQFLLESIILSASGGIMGIIFGVFFSFLVSVIMTKSLSINWPFVFPLSGLIIGIVASSLIGLIFGIYPARKAANKSPIEALRYE